MRRRAFLSSSVGLLAGCASGAALHAGPSNLAAREGGPRPGEAEKWPAGIPKTLEESQHQVMGPTQVGSGSFVRGPERSGLTPPAIRDDLGRLNQRVTTGESLVPGRHHLRVRPGTVAVAAERGLGAGRPKCDRPRGLVRRRRGVGRTRAGQDLGRRPRDHPGPGGREKGPPRARPVR